MTAMVADAAWAIEVPREPVRLIFDTDMGNDVDDAMALAVIHALQGRGECELLAVTVTKDNRYAAPVVDVINTFYGYGDIPIGVVHDGVTPDDGKYLRQLGGVGDNGNPNFPHDLLDGGNAPEAVGLLRKTLAAQPDDSVVIVQVGFSTNLARLLESNPDDVSPLSGRALVKKKVRLLSAMAGAFTPELRAERRKEYNIVRDVKSAQRVFQEWPTSMVLSGWEIGHAIMQPAVGMRNDYYYVERHPVQVAYGYYRGLKNDQPTYDLTSVLYAVRPDRGYFSLSEAGRIVVEEDGFARFEPGMHGLARHLTVSPEQIARTGEALALLSSQPPSKPAVDRKWRLAD